MSGTEHLTALQVEVAETFFAIEAARGYLVAGGAALVAIDAGFDTTVLASTVGLRNFSRAEPTSGSMQTNRVRHSRR